MTAAIGLMAKAPVPGEVKTRLCPPLDPAEACEAAVGMLRDCVDTVSVTDAVVWCVHTGRQDQLAPHLPTGTRFLRQRGQGLAERLAAAQQDLHDHGYDGVVLVGADCPTLDAAYLREAVSALRGSTVVLGPSTDGGYNLIGSGRPIPSLFEVRMSTGDVLDETVARAQAAGLTTRLLTPRTDLDTVDDVLAARHAGWLEHAPRTRELAERLRRRSPMPPA